MPSYWYDHIHLVSPNPEKTAQFYERMFSAKLIGIRQTSDGRTRVELNLNGSRLLLVSGEAQPEPAPASPESRYGLDHIALRTDNLAAAVDDLKAKGVEFKEEIRVVRPGVKLAFLLAPENVLIELVEKSN